MEPSTWKCETCQFENPEQLLECMKCYDNKPQLNNAPVLIVQQKKNIITPQLLLEVFKGKVLYSENVGNYLLKIFDPEKPLVPVIAAGQVGTGKSTWMNSLVYEFTKNDQSGVEFSNFSVGHGNKSHTEGLWVYPYSFRHEKYPNTQFMLCDMEGMGGLKDIDGEILESGLKRLYTFVKFIFLTFIYN